MAKNLPYVTSIGTLERMLEKITTAAVPERFTQDFVSTKLAMKGGTARSIIPFIKKMGLVSGDGSPTTLYHEFRNPSKSEAAMAACIKKLYASLFEMNEYANALSIADLRGLIVEATGAAPDSAVVEKTVGTLNALKKLADFDAGQESEATPEIIEKNETPKLDKVVAQVTSEVPESSSSQGEGINLSYTINLNLPTTTDIDVFNAIFKSLKEHLLNK